MHTQQVIMHNAFHTHLVVRGVVAGQRLLYALAERLVLRAAGRRRRAVRPLLAAQAALLLACAVFERFHQTKGRRCQHV